MVEEEDDVAELKAFEFVPNEHSLLCDDPDRSMEIDDGSMEIEKYVSKKIVEEEEEEEVQETQRHDVMVEKDEDDSNVRNSLELRNHGDSTRMWEQLAFPSEHVADDVVREEQSFYVTDHLDDVEEQASH